MTGIEGKTTTFDTFNGLRTDTPASKVDSEHSPDCSDVVFAVGSVSTRNPLRIVDVAPGNIVGRWEFVGRDTALYVMFLCSDGALYSQQGGTYLQLDQVTPGSECKAIVAYGRLYMAFFALDGSGGTDAPRCWDGINLYRVSQGGPGAAPSVTCVALAGADLSGTPLLVRTNSEVTASTDPTPHNLQEGFKVAITGVDDQVYTITSIETNAEDFAGQAEITFASDPGFVPGDTLSIKNVPYVVAGGGVLGYDIRNGIASVTMNSAHGLSVGLQVDVSLHTYAPRSVTVTAILSPTVWTYETEEPNVTDTGGYVHVPWPGGDTGDYPVAEVPTATTVRIAFQASDFTWTGGNVTFPWNGSFFVDSVPTPTTFTYQQSGPDASASGTTGTATPQGQISPGEHQCCEIYVTKTGSLTPASPPFRFIAKVNQYPVVTASIGPNNIKGRIFAFTGVNGGDFAILRIAARVGGIPVSTSTQIKDNTSPSALFDFSDATILSAERIDIPGFNLFQNYPLTTPDGVEWFNDRMFWKRNLNVELGIRNMAFDGGTSISNSIPRGWTVVSAGGGVAQYDYMPVYEIAAGQTGEINQPVYRNFDGVQTIKENTRYRMRLWVDGAHPGAVVAALIGTGVNITATVSLTGRGYMQADFIADTPAVIPSDIVLSVKGASSQILRIRDMQLVYRDNPVVFPAAVASYVRLPDNYDGVTGLSGPNDDASGLSAMFLMQENFYGITNKGRLYYVQPLGTAEPSSWNWQGLADDCDAFHANAVTTGKGFAVWGGNKGAFWFTGGIPFRASAMIDPTWAAQSNLTGIVNDARPLAKRIYFGTTPPLVYDYHDLELGGSGKWTPWNVPTTRLSLSQQFGALLCANAKTYRVDNQIGVADDDFGNIGGYYTFASAGTGMFQKSFNYLWMRMSGLGGITPFLYKKNLLAPTATLNAQILQNDPDAVIEYPVNVTQARLLYLKIGLLGSAFTCEGVQISFMLDPNSPNSGTRR